MNGFEDSLHRVLARSRRQAISARTSSRLSPDPDVTIGVATIKIVTEEHIQALAFGSLDQEPTIVVRLDPIGRDVSDLLPFARFLDENVTRAMSAGAPLRVWIPHAITLEALDVLGHRYWRNRTAQHEIVRMGELCRVIAHEATIPGQQLVADATALLQDHVVTGMSPIEEGHLDAILAWFDPSVPDPLVESRERVRLPASGILPNTPDHPEDDRIDRLRKEAKAARGSRRARLEAQIAAILRHWVRREWQLLVEGRQAFLGLGLPSSGLDELVADSSKRVGDALANGFYPARQPHRLAAELGTMEAGEEKATFAALENDPMLRQQAIRAGGVVAGEVGAVRQPRPGYNPCSIDIHSQQGVNRLRQDDKVRILGTNVTGVVRGLSSIPGGVRIDLEIKTGVRTRHVLTTGAPVELVRAPFAFVNYRALSAVAAQQPWVFYSSAPPVLSARTPPVISALAAAQAMRRP
ncbi:hypothetical protein HMF7854_04265 [Sphingomonas ginkgonis]|uniref:Uncharacterized protein n=1 Tax=Sphingomonas ginkgonis TaxID=2315330 RepID=A0A429V864_9SPHN|nr:hypothetical protein [Sphingomonas ginkgonis]RST30125.1 hypothetical protein HMF7854_04265 [Sphingomonas ginkgonis]